MLEDPTITFERATRALYSSERCRILYFQLCYFNKMPLYESPKAFAELDKTLAEQVGRAPSVYEKFAKIKPSRTLEENLLWSADRNDVAFVVAEEISQSLQTRHISLDLNAKTLHLWSLNFEQCVLSKRNPFSAHNFTSEA